MAERLPGDGRGLRVLGPAAPRRDGAHERVVVCRRASTLCPQKFFMLLPKASTNLPGAEALFDMNGRSVWDLGPAAPRRDGAHERVVVCRRASALCPTIFLMLLPKASTNLPGAEAIFDLSGRSVEDMGHVSSTPWRICAAAWNSSLEIGLDRKGAPSPNELKF